MFDRNQGEIARTRYALTQAEEQDTPPAIRFFPMLPTPTKQ